LDLHDPEFSPHEKRDARGRTGDEYIRVRLMQHLTIAVRKPGKIVPYYLSYKIITLGHRWFLWQQISTHKRGPHLWASKSNLPNDCPNAHQAGRSYFRTR